MKITEYVIVYSFIVFGIFYTSCSRENEIRNEIVKMSARPVALNTEEMWKWTPDLFSNEQNRDSVEIKMVVYTDSTQCSTCHLKSLELWKDLLCLEQKSNGRIEFIFIFEPSFGFDSTLYQSMYLSKLNHSMYIDTKHLIRNYNSHIPDSPMFHAFVLNKDNNILLVGNPLYNENIEKLFLRIASKYMLEDVKLDSLGHIVFYPKISSSL